MRVRQISAIVFALLPQAFACGGSDEGKESLALYAGNFLVLELFQEQNGASCPAPPADTENRVVISIEKNDFVAVFEQRWGKMVGQINSDTSFLAVNSEPQVDLSLKFTGDFPDRDHFQGLMQETVPGCNRQRKMQGTRTGVTP